VIGRHDIHDVSGTGSVFVFRGKKRNGSAQLGPSERAECRYHNSILKMEVVRFLRNVVIEIITQ
jgi:hypothetical protein